MSSDYDEATRNERRAQRAWRRHRVTCHSCRRPQALAIEDTTRCDAGNLLFIENRRLHHERLAFEKTLEQPPQPTHQRILKWTSMK